MLFGFGDTLGEYRSLLSINLSNARISLVRRFSFIITDDESQAERLEQISLSLLSSSFGSAQSLNDPSKSAPNRVKDLIKYNCSDMAFSLTPTMSLKFP